MHAQSNPTLCHPKDSPGSSLHGILQAGILEWVVVPSSRDLPDPGSNWHLLHCRWILYPQATGGSPEIVMPTKYSIFSLMSLRPLATGEDQVTTPIKKKKRAVVMQVAFPLRQ